MSAAGANPFDRMLAVIPLLLTLVTAGNAGAHDVWLYPERGRLMKDDTLIVRQLLGSDLETDVSSPEGALELPILWHLTPRFQLFGPKGPIDLRRELTKGDKAPVVKPVVSRPLEADGLALVSMDHEVIYTAHTVEDFVKYLEHEEFDKAEFQDHMGARDQQSEVYGRGLKTLVQVGAGGGGDLYKRVIGQPLEIVLLQNPYRLDIGDELGIEVIFDGAPLAGQLIKAYDSDGQAPATKTTLRTDKNGVARLRLERRGFWLLRLVHLFPCSDRFGADCDDADWESYWASYSFKLD